MSRSRRIIRIRRCWRCRCWFCDPHGSKEKHNKKKLKPDPELIQEIKEAA